MLITFRVNYSESFRRGVQCPCPPTVTLDIDPGSLTQEQRDLIAARLNNEGVVLSRCTIHGHLQDKSTITAAEPTLEGLLAEISQQETRYAEQQQLKADNEAATAARYEAAARQVLAERRAKPVSGNFVYVWHQQSGWCHNVNNFSPSAWDRASRRTRCRIETTQPDWDYYAPESVRKSEDALAWQAELDAANATLLQQIVTDAIASIEDEERDRAEWIIQYGSARLRRLRGESIPHDETYQRERAAWTARMLASQVAASYSGWSIVDEDVVDMDVSDVPDTALAILDAAREAIPTARLGRYQDRYVAVAEHDGSGPVDGHSVTIIWPGE